MTDARSAALDGALALLRQGSPISLDLAARSAGLSKPGLMYHFATKEALMLGLVDHVVERWQLRLEALIDGDPELASPHERIRAYLLFSLSGDFDPSDAVILADPRLRSPLRDRWTQRMEPSITLPRGMDEDERARLLTARLIADGAWFADAMEVFPLSAPDRSRVLETALRLLEADR